MANSDPLSTEAQPGGLKRTQEPEQRLHALRGTIGY